MRTRLLLCFALLCFLASPGRGDTEAAEDPDPMSHWKDFLGGTFGGSILYGTERNSQLGLPWRAMDGLSLNLLTGVRYGNWLLGLDLDYRWTGQISGLSGTVGNDLSGHGYLLGLGANYAYDAHWRFQISYDFLGSFYFSQQSGSGDDHLSNPFNLRLKVQYALTPMPFSLDAGLQYGTWSTFRLASVDRTSATSLLMLTFGITFHFRDHLAPLPEKSAAASAPEKGK